MYLRIQNLDAHRNTKLLYVHIPLFQRHRTALMTKVRAKASLFQSPTASVFVPKVTSTSKMNLNFGIADSRRKSPRLSSTKVAATNNKAQLPVGKSPRVTKSAHDVAKENMASRKSGVAPAARKSTSMYSLQFRPIRTITMTAQAEASVCI